MGWMVCDLCSAFLLRLGKLYKYKYKYAIPPEADLCLLLKLLLQLQRIIVGGPELVVGLA